MKIINNIYTRLLALAALSAMVFASCETPLDIEYLDTEEKVVVNAMGNTDENLNLRLTYSRWFLSEKPFKEIDNATVSLIANGQKVDEGALRVDGSTYPEKKYYSFDNYLPKEGDMLKLDIQVPGEEPISAECRVPYKPQMSNFTVKEHNVIRNWEFPFFCTIILMRKTTICCKFILSTKIISNIFQLQIIYLLKPMLQVR